MVLNQDDYFNLENVGYYCISDDDIRNHDSKWLWSVAYFLNSRLARPLGYHRICNNTYLSFLYSSFTHVNKKIELDYYQEFFKKRFSIMTNHQTIQYIYYPCTNEYEYFALIKADEIIKIQMNITGNNKWLVFKLLCIYRLNMQWRDYRKNTPEDIARKPRVWKCLFKDISKAFNEENIGNHKIKTLLKLLHNLEIIDYKRAGNFIKTNNVKESYGRQFLYITDHYKFSYLEIEEAVYKDYGMRIRVDTLHEGG